jgi:RNA polymerase sigma factor (sigma-70 family)
VGSKQYFITPSVFILMEPPEAPATPNDRSRDLEEAVRRERSKLSQFIRRRVRNPSDAEDLLQDVLHEFVQAYRLPEPIEQIGSWLFHVARNRIIDRFRKSKRRLVREPDVALADSQPDYQLDLALPGLDQGPEALYARSIILDALQRVLEELPPPQRDVFIEHELAGRSFKEISETTGISVNTLLSRKHGAILHLRNRLQVYYDDLNF